MPSDAAEEDGSDFEASDFEAVLRELFQLDPAARQQRLQELARRNAELAQAAAAALRDYDAALELASGHLDDVHETLIGMRIAGYVLEERIGKGGMGSVFRARHPVAGVAAIKLTNRPLGMTAIDERHQREVELLARIGRHPNIVGIRGAGSDDVGRAFVIMDFIDGFKLASDEGLAVLQDLDTTVDMLTQIASAVARLHDLGIVHRDLSPANILVSKVNGEWFPIVIDLGIAKDLEQARGAARDNGSESRAENELEEAEEYSNERQRPRAFTSRLAGTQRFIAPEQAQEGAAMDARVDVFGLGALSYWALTGTTQRPDENGRVAPPSSCVREASFADAALRAKRMRGELDAVVQKAMASAPIDRYSSALAMADDLRRFAEGRPVLALSPSRWRELRAFVGRNRLLVAMAATLFVVVSAAAIYSTVQFVRERALRRIATENYAYAEASTTFFYERVFREVAKSKQGFELPTRALLEGMALRVLELQREPNALPLLCQVTSYLVQIFDQLGDYARSDELIAKTEDLVEAVDAGNASRARYETARAAALLIRPTRDKVRLADTVQRLEASWHGLRDETGGMVPQNMPRRRDLLGAIAQSMAAAYFDIDNAQEGEAWTQRAIDCWGEDSPFSAFAYNDLSARREAAGDLEAAIGYLERARRIILPELDGAVVDPRFHPYAGPLLANLAYMLRRNGEAERALPIAERAVDLSRTHSLGDTHPNHFATLHHLGMVQFESGRLEAAAKTFEEILALQSKAPGADDTAIGTTHSHLAAVRRKLGDNEAALRHAAQAEAKVATEARDADFQERLRAARAR